jgi:hypothetical protein
MNLFSIHIIFQIWDHQRTEGIIKRQGKNFLTNKNLTCRGKTAPTVFQLRRRPSHTGRDNPPNPYPTLTQRHRSPVRTTTTYAFGW